MYVHHVSIRVTRKERGEKDDNDKFVFVTLIKLDPI